MNVKFHTDLLSHRVQAPYRHRIFRQMHYSVPALLKLQKYRRQRLATKDNNNSENYNHLNGQMNSTYEYRMQILHLSYKHHAIFSLFHTNFLSHPMNGI